MRIADCGIAASVARTVPDSAIRFPRFLPGYRLFLVLAIRTVSLDLFPIPPSSRYEPLHHLFDHGRTRKR